MRPTRFAHRPAGTLATIAATIAALFVLPACGAEDTGSATAVRTPDGAAALDPAAPAQASAGTSPSEAWCDAYADFEAAQDGAQRNTAIAGMEAALTDTSGEVGQALDTLQQGDLAPSEYAAAEAVLAAYAQGCPTPPAAQRATG